MKKKEVKQFKLKDEVMQSKLKNHVTLDSTEMNQLKGGMSYNNGVATTMSIFK